MAVEEDVPIDAFSLVLDDMTKSISSVREVIKGFTKNFDLETTDGISLLSLKHHLLLSYIQSLSLMTAHRVLGRSLTSRSRQSQPFNDSSRGARGSAAGDLVDTLIEDRIILEKVRQLESRMRYQIEKLIRIAEEDAARKEVDVINDPLSFRPNPENLVNKVDSEPDSDTKDVATNEDGRGVYRPPKLAPMPYIETKDKSKRRAPLPAGLAALAHLDGIIPHVESTSGLGSIPSMASSRAQELARMNEFEEENMSRLVMTKKEARRRAKDEEDIALGGSGVSRGRRRGGGLEDEFGDILRAVDRSHTRGMDDGYEALRVKGRKQDVLSRSRTRLRDDDDVEGGRVRKKSRFQAAVKTMNRRQRRS